MRRGGQADLGGRHRDERRRAQAGRGCHQHPHHGLQQRRHRRQAAHLRRDGRLHPLAPRNHRQRAERRGPRHRELQEGQPYGGPRERGDAQRRGELAVQGRGALAREPNQRGGVHPLLPARQGACRRPDSRHGRHRQLGHHRADFGLQRGDSPPREAQREQLGQQPRDAGAGQQPGGRTPLHHRLARLAHPRARNPAQRPALGGGAGQPPHLDGPLAGEGDARHRPPAENQGGALPLPAQQAGGDAAQPGRGGEQRPRHRPGIRLGSPHRPQIVDDSRHCAHRRTGHSLRPALPAEHARHDHPRPQGHRGESERPLPG